MKTTAKLALIWLVSPLLTINQSQAQETSVTWFGFSQITAEGGHGVATSVDGSDNGLRFGADRVRTGFKAKRGRAFARLQVDFNRPDVSLVTSGVPEVIKDAEVGYIVAPRVFFKAGIFKTPVGMDFNTSGTKLDITKRGMEKALVLERTLGAMVSGRNVLGGLGYDVGILNPASRSAAVMGGTAGVDYAYALRLMYDLTGVVHGEVSYGGSGDANGLVRSTLSGKSEDYNVWDAGISYRRGGITLKGEWISGTNLHGEDGVNQQVWYVHGGYRLGDRFEPVLRHYRGKTKPDGSQLGNTFLGINIFLNPEEPYTTRVQLNFVLAGVTKGRLGEDWSGLGGYTENAFLAQFQFAF